MSMTRGRGKTAMVMILDPDSGRHAAELRLYAQP